MKAYVTAPDRRNHTGQYPYMLNEPAITCEMCMGYEILRADCEGCNGHGFIFVYKRDQ